MAEEYAAEITLAIDQDRLRDTTLSLRYSPKGLQHADVVVRLQKLVIDIQRPRVRPDVIQARGLALGIADVQPDHFQTGISVRGLKTNQIRYVPPRRLAPDPPDVEQDHFAPILLQRNSKAIELSKRRFHKLLGNRRMRRFRPRLRVYGNSSDKDHEK